MDEMSNFPNLGEATVADVCRTELKLSPARQAADPRQISAPCVTPNSCGEKLVCFRNVTRGARALACAAPQTTSVFSGSGGEELEAQPRHEEEEEGRRRGICGQRQHLVDVVQPGAVRQRRPR